MTAWGSKRSRLEIYLDILKVLRKGESRPTRIMYQSNLSWKPLMKILDSLIKQEIVEATQDQLSQCLPLNQKRL